MPSKEEKAAQAAQAARTQPPPENTGSGQYAVWDHDLGQYVSGVSDQATANSSLDALQGSSDGGDRITDGHQLSVREV